MSLLKGNFKSKKLIKKNFPRRKNWRKSLRKKLQRELVEVWFMLKKEDQLGFKRLKHIFFEK